MPSQTVLSPAVRFLQFLVFRQDVGLPLDMASWLSGTLNKATEYAANLVEDLDQEEDEYYEDGAPAAS